VPIAPAKPVTPPPQASVPDGANAGLENTIPPVATIAPPVSNRPVVPEYRRAHIVPAPVRMKPPAFVRAAAKAPPKQTAPKQVATAEPKLVASLSPVDRLAALANTGNAKAQLLLGLRYLDGDGTSVNEAEAAKWLERAANQGEAVAAYRMGTLYERGHGVPVDAAKATQWYATAAKQGNRKAMHNLAVAYAQGTGVEKNLTIAAQWFTHAANLGLADSQFNLAVLYERGMGVPQSLPDAYKWYAIAAAQGDSESKARIDALSTQLSADDKAAAEKAAANFHAQTPDRTANLPPDQMMLMGG